MDTTIWDEILARVETKVNDHSFSTWFKPTSFIADAGESITVRVPTYGACVKVGIHRSHLAAYLRGVRLDYLGTRGKGR